MVEMLGSSTLPFKVNILPEAAKKALFQVYRKNLIENKRLTFDLKSNGVKEELLRKITQKEIDTVIAIILSRNILTSEHYSETQSQLLEQWFNSIPKQMELKPLHMFNWWLDQAQTFGFQQTLYKKIINKVTYYMQRKHKSFLDVRESMPCDENTNNVVKKRQIKALEKLKKTDSALRKRKWLEDQNLFIEESTEIAHRFKYTTKMQRQSVEGLQKEIVLQQLEHDAQIKRLQTKILILEDEKLRGQSEEEKEPQKQGYRIQFLNDLGSKNRAIRNPKTSEEQEYVNRKNTMNNHVFAHQGIFNAYAIKLQEKASMDQNLVLRLEREQSKVRFTTSQKAFYLLMGASVPLHIRRIVSNDMAQLHTCIVCHNIIVFNGLDTFLESQLQYSCSRPCAAAYCYGCIQKVIYPQPDRLSANAITLIPNQCFQCQADIIPESKDRFLSMILGQIGDKINIIHKNVKRQQRENLPVVGWDKEFDLLKALTAHKNDVEKHADKNGVIIVEKLLNKRIPIKDLGSDDE